MNALFLSVSKIQNFLNNSTFGSFKDKTDIHMNRNLIFALLLFPLFGLLISCNNDKKDDTADLNVEEAAMQKLSALIRENPEKDDLYFERAKLYYENEAYDEAIDDLNAAQGIDSVNADYFHLLADVQLDYYRSFEALKTMQKVVALHPKRIAGMLKLAEFQYILKRYDESINTLNNILAIDRLQPEAFFMLGMNFRELDQQEMAKNSFQTAVENDPELLDAWMMLGNILEKEGDDKALVCYNNILLVDAENVEAMHAKAFYFQNNKDIDKALEIYREINLIDPKYSDAYLNAGLLHLELDSLQKANELFNIMTQIDLTNPIPYFYRAYTFELVGQKEKAIRDYEQALKLAPDLKEAKQALESLRQKEED